MADPIGTPPTFADVQREFSTRAESHVGGGVPVYDMVGMMHAIHTLRVRVRELERERESIRAALIASSSFALKDFQESYAAMAARIAELENPSDVVLIDAMKKGWDVFLSDAGEGSQYECYAAAIRDALRGGAR